MQLWPNILAFVAPCGCVPRRWTISCDLAPAPPRLISGQIGAGFRWLHLCVPQPALSDPELAKGESNGCPLWLSSCFSDHVRCRRSRRWRRFHPYPLPRWSQIGVEFKGVHPNRSQIGVDFSALASIGVEFKAFPLCSAACPERPEGVEWVSSVVKGSWGVPMSADQAWFSITRSPDVPITRSLHPLPPGSN